MTTLIEIRTRLDAIAGDLDAVLGVRDELSTLADDLAAIIGEEGVPPPPPPPPPGPTVLDLTGVKLTLPINAAGELSGLTDAHEIMQPELATYTHPIYYVPQADGSIRMSSPIRPGAYTSSNATGPARCEYRHMTDTPAGGRIHFRSVFRLVQAAPGSKITCVQIHRLDGNPVLKGVIQVDANGTTFRYRALVKATNTATSDIPFDDGLGDRTIAAGLAFNTDVTIDVDWNAETLSIAVNGGTPRVFTGIQSSGLAAYVKPVGPYPSDKGTGLDSDLSIIDAVGFTLL